MNEEERGFGFGFGGIWWIIIIVIIILLICPWIFGGCGVGCNKKC